MAAKIALEELYDAVFDDDAFDHILHRLTAAIGARSFVAGWHHHDGTASLFRSSGYWSDEQMARYNRDFALTDIWNVAVLRNWRENCAIDNAAMVSDREFEDSVLHNEFFRSIGDDTFRSLSVPTGNAWGKGAIAFHRGRSQQGFDEGAVRLLDEYAAHLGPLLALRGKFAALERRAVVFGAALDNLAQAVIITRADGEIVHANAAGEALIGQDATMRGKAAGLGLRGVDCTKLQPAIAAACIARGPQIASMLLPRSHGRPLVATVLPMRSSTGARQALLFIQDLMPSDDSLVGRLESLFGLTPAEAAVASLIADGVTPAQIASQRLVSVETVRAQLKSLMQKLGCRRQTEAAAIIRSIMPVRAHQPSGSNGGG